LQRLRDAHAQILRTDRSGAIHILTDGKNLEISCFLDCSQIVSVKDPGSSQPPDHK